MAVRISLTGRVGVEAGDQGAAELGLGRLGSLALAYLVTARHRPVSHDELAEALWEESLPRSWRTSLRGIISRLRGVLAAAGLPPREVLVSSPGCYQLQLPPDTVVDVEDAAGALRRAAQALASGRAEEARHAAAGAVAVAARPFLPGAHGLWAEQRQAELRELRVQALETMAEACAAGGRYDEALRAAEEAVALEPLREASHRRLMLVHAAAGNRAAALRAYERCRRVLAEELGVSPAGATEAVYLGLLEDEGPEPEAGAPPADVGRAGPPVRLPLTSFVGRAERVRQVVRLLGTGRLVTLTGPGGVGKTRLALEVAAELAASCTGGIHLAELAPMVDPSHLSRHVLAAVGGREEPGQGPIESLAAHLGGGPALLVLDNCEHMVDACAELADFVLRECPSLRVLATSREPLGLLGETRWLVPLLGTPPTEVGELAAVVECEAVQLFLDRARSVCPELAVGDEDVMALGRICRRLDGLPLALELAAGRVGVLSLQEIAERLDDRFRLLAAGPNPLPARHRSIGAMLDWSRESLSEPERLLFARLSVFAGSFTLDAAERVCHGAGIEPAGVWELLGQLANKSLVVAERDGGLTRYRLLETVRQYGRQVLEDLPGQADAVRGRHLEWATALAEQAERHLDGPDQAAWLQRLEQSHEDLQAALGWALSTNDQPLGLRLAAALGRFWQVRGHLSTGRAWLDRALAEVTVSPPLVRAKALAAAAVLAEAQGDYERARSLYQETLVICRTAGDRQAMASALHGLGNIAALRGDLAEARTLYEETLGVGREIGHDGVVSASLTNIGSVAQNQGDLATARSCFEESLVLTRALGDRHRAALVVGNLGYLSFQQGDYARARALFEDSLAERRELGDTLGVVSALCNLGYLALAEDRHDEAARLLDESLTLARRVGDRYWATLSLLRLARVARARGDHDRAAAFDREAVGLARGLGAKRAIAEWLEGVASSAASQGDFARVGRLLGAADALRGAIGAPLPPRDAAAQRAHLEAARHALGTASFDRHWAAGRNLPLGEALHSALAPKSSLQEENRRPGG